MTRSPKAGAGRHGGASARRLVVMAAAGLAGLAVAALASIAVAKSFTVNVTNHVSVGAKTESVASNSKGLTLYTLSGESAKPKHLFCTSALCLSTWPMLTVKSAKAKLSKATGIKGRLGTLKRGSKFQVTLNGHPLYAFSGDSKGQAGGEGLTIGSHIWHAVKADSSSKTTSTGTTTSTTTTTTTSTSSTCSLYPPYC